MKTPGRVADQVWSAFVVGVVAAATDVGHLVVKRRLSDQQQYRFFVAEASVAGVVGTIAIFAIAHLTLALAMAGVLIAAAKGAVELYIKQRT